MGRCFGWGTGGGAFPTRENGPRAGAGLGPDTKKSRRACLARRGAARITWLAALGSVIRAVGFSEAAVVRG